MISRIAFCSLVILVAGICNNAIASEQLIYEILDAADQRKAASQAYDRALAGNNHRQQKTALLALGRVGDKSGTLKISPFLYSPQPDIRAMAAFALGINNDPKAHKLLLMRLKSEQNPVVISRLLVAIGNTADPQGAIASILPFLNHHNDDVVAAACDGLTLAWTFHRETVSIPNSTQVHRLLQLVAEKKTTTTHCLYTLSRLRRETALFDIQQLLSVAEKLRTTEAKILVIRIMGALKNTAFQDYLIHSIEPENPVIIRAEAASALASLDYQEQLLPSIIKLANDTSSHVKVNLIDSLTLSTTNKPLLDIAEQLVDDKSQWVRHRAILALFAIKGGELEPLFLKLVSAADFQSQQLALQILREYQLPKQQQYLETLAQSEHKGVKSIASRLINNEDADAEEYSPPKKNISAEKAFALAGKKLRIITAKGAISIQLLTSTPFTSANFYQLAMSGYYNGLSFHRVIANFVVQSGDPENTGQGGPGYSIREELYPVEHKRGTVGIATSGKDTGGSQFFFNNVDNIHLNSHYTVFARVIKGLDLIDKLEVGDRIISVSELP